MSRKDIWKDGKQFSSEYQPPNENKKAPRFKTRLRKLLNENYEEISKAIIQECKEGSIRHIEFVRDWLYGKVKEETEVTIKDYSRQAEKVREVISESRSS